MNQQWLVKHVLQGLKNSPDEPHPGLGRYLSFEEALAIVDETIDHVGAQNDDVEYTYLNGHRKRLAHSLSMIPKARSEDASCLDVGCYGYMGLWAKKYLGYDNVQGVEWRPESDEAVITRTISLHDESIEFKSFNFDISEPDWPIDEQFDVILFFEVLEHINRDPMGVMVNINRRLKTNGALVMSVPNAISYKTLREMLVGMPPWTYWFFEPDLSHEPRHCFEYTPIIFKMLLKAAGFEEKSFKTIYAYSKPEDQTDMLEIAEALSIDADHFGETMIAQAAKTSDDIPVRYPDVLYSPDRYYQSAFPVLLPRLTEAIERFHEIARKDTKARSDDAEATNGALAIAQARLKAMEDQCTRSSQEVESLRDHATNLERERSELRTQIDELLFTCDCYLQNDTSSKQLEQELESARIQIEELNELRPLAEQARELQSQVGELARENEDLHGKVKELLFTCDGHMQTAERARKRAEDAERELEAASARIEALSRSENDLKAEVNQLLFTCDCYLQNETDSRKAAETAAQRADDAENALNEARAQIEQLTTTNADLQAKVNQLLFTCDCYLQTEAESKQAAATAESQVAELDGELEQSRSRIVDLTRENSELRAQVNELLFTCDCYLQRVNDVTHCSQVVREARFRRVLDRSKSIARKIPILRSVLRPMYDRLKRTVKRFGLHEAVT